MRTKPVLIPAAPGFFVINGEQPGMRLPIVAWQFYQDKHGNEGSELEALTLHGELYQRNNFDAFLYPDGRVRDEDREFGSATEFYSYVAALPSVYDTLSEQEVAVEPA